MFFWYSLFRIYDNKRMEIKKKLKKLNILSVYVRYNFVVYKIY